MRAVETIKNIWKIEDLRNRILTTLLLVAIYRFGTYVVLPGIDPKALTALQAQTRGGLLALLDMFSVVVHFLMLLFLHWVLCPISPLQLLCSC